MQYIWKIQHCYPGMPVEWMHAGRSHMNPIWRKITEIPPGEAHLFS